MATALSNMRYRVIDPSVSPADAGGPAVVAYAATAL
jgi:hypothetical protein